MLYLVRHGESTLNAAGVKYGHLNPPLTLAGIEQANATATELNGRVNVIVTSPLARAHHFALLLAERLGLGQPLVSSALIERSFGAAEGLTAQQIARDYPGRVPLMESDAQAAARARNFLLDLNTTAAIITHKGVIRGLTGTPLDNGAVIAWDPFDIEQLNAGIGYLNRPGDAGDAVPA